MKSRGRHLRQPLYSEQCSQPFEHDGGTSVLTDGRKKREIGVSVILAAFPYSLEDPFVIPSVYMTS